MQAWSSPDALAKCNQTVEEDTLVDVEIPGTEVAVGDQILLSFFCL